MTMDNEACSQKVTELDARCKSLETALRRAHGDLIKIGNQHQVWGLVDLATARIERALSSN